MTDLVKPDNKPLLPNPLPINVWPIKWEVIQQEGPKYCITPQSYENLSMTQADTLRWIREAKWRLNYYRGEAQDAK